MQDAFHIVWSVCYFQIGCHVSKFPCFQICHEKQGREGHSISAALGHCHLPQWHWGGSECASGSRNLPATGSILPRQQQDGFGCRSTNCDTLVPSSTCSSWRGDPQVLSCYRGHLSDFSQFTAVTQHVGFYSLPTYQVPHQHKSSTACWKTAPLCPWDPHPRQHPMVLWNDIQSEPWNCARTIESYCWLSSFIFNLSSCFFFFF